MLLLVSAALAGPAELPGSLAMPTAAPLGSGHGQVGVGVLVGLPGLGGYGPALSATMRAHAGITERLAITGALAAPDTGLLVGLRYNVVQTSGFRLAPWVLGAASSELVTVDLPLGQGVAALGGLAIEAGGRSARFDLSLPLVDVPGMYPYDLAYLPLGFGSLGVTVPLGPTDALRVGVESLISPALTWRHAAPRWYVQATGLYVLLWGEPMLAAEGGLRF